MSHVIPMPQYCVINLHETERPIWCGGSLQECFNWLVREFGSAFYRSVETSGLRVVPIRQKNYPYDYFQPPQKRPL